jgi:hypothetical protein
MTQINNKFAIYTNQIDKTIIEPIKTFITDKYGTRNDFNIFSDVLPINSEPSYAVLSSFYLPFHNGILVFTNVDDFINIMHSISNDIVVYVIADKDITVTDPNRVKLIKLIDNKVIEI